MTFEHRPGPFPPPPNVQARLAEPRSLGTLDAMPEQWFNGVVELAAYICDTPIALVSLVDSEREWVKAATGLDGAMKAPRAHAFCAHAILQEHLLEVPDAALDDRFRDNPLVTGAPHIRFYAGQPLVTHEGRALGTLCVIDRRPRALTPPQKRALETLARGVARQLRAQRDRAALDDARAMLAQVMDAAPALISYRDRELRYRFVNRALAAYLGRDAGELLGRPPAEVLAPAVLARNIDLMQRARVGEHVIALQDVTRTDGTAGTLQLDYRPARDAQGAVIGVYGFHTDITEQLRAKQEILVLNAGLERRVAERTVELEEALADLQLYTYAVSHDLRAPLRHLSGFTALAAEALAAGDAAEATRLFARVLQATENLRTLVDELDKLARVSREPLAVGTVPMEAVVREAWNALDDRLPRQLVRFEVGQLPEALVDRVLMQQVFVNLLANAVKFSAGVDAPAVRVTWRATATGGEYCVRDNGVGFDMAYARKLFQPFSRLHSRAAFSGTGNGLAIVERIVRRHGGSVSADSPAGGGASFCFTLPAQAVAQ